MPVLLATSAPSRHNANVNLAVLFLSYRDAVFLSSCRGKLWHDKPAALGPLKVRQTVAAVAAVAVKLAQRPTLCGIQQQHTKDIMCV
jgi:hypothetical protein